MRAVHVCHFECNCAQEAAVLLLLLVLALRLHPAVVAVAGTDAAIAGAAAAGTDAAIAAAAAAATAQVDTADHTPLEDDEAYASAFIQVINLWLKNDTCREFAFGKRLARIAAELMQVRGRLGWMVAWEPLESAMWLWRVTLLLQHFILHCRPCCCMRLCTPSSFS
jgi:hypothetical protein